MSVVMCDCMLPKNDCCVLLHRALLIRIFMSTARTTSYFWICLQCCAWLGTFFRGWVMYMYARFFVILVVCRTFCFGSLLLKLSALRYEQNVEWLCALLDHTVCRLFIVRELNVARLFKLWVYFAMKWLSIGFVGTMYLLLSKDILIHLLMFFH